MPLRMWTNMRIHLRKECVYKPPNKCEETSDLKDGTCSECQLFNQHGEKYTHNNGVNKTTSFQAWDITTVNTTEREATTEL